MFANPYGYRVLVFHSQDNLAVPAIGPRVEQGFGKTFQRIASLDRDVERAVHHPVGQRGVHLRELLVGKRPGDLGQPESRQREAIEDKMIGADLAGLSGEQAVIHDDPARG